MKQRNYSITTGFDQTESKRPLSAQHERKQPGRRSFPSVWFLLFAAGGAVGLISLVAIGALFAVLFARPVASNTSAQSKDSTRILVPARAQNSGNVTPLPASPNPLTPVQETKPPAYVSPRPLTQPVPDVTLLPAGAIEGPLRLEVQVKINPIGRVTDALITNDSNISEGLANAVLNAAKRWTFAPATRGGRPVASDHTIVFQFGGPAPK